MMRQTLRSLFLLGAVVCYAMATMVFTACSDNSYDNPVPEQEQLAEYTIIYYANGGGNVDNDILVMLEDLYLADVEAYKKVNVVVQYKFSTAEHLIKGDLKFEDEASAAFYGGKTLRWHVDPTQGLVDNLQSPASIYGADNADCTYPDSLTNFINWAAKTYPAKKYMLIVNDHGGGYRPDDDLPETTPASTRGLIYDDGYDGKHFSAKSFARAIQQADIRFETIYTLACLMNNLEYLFELKDLCDYIIATTYVMPSDGGALDELVNQLGQSGVDIEKALDAYAKADVESWDVFGNVDETTPCYTDMTVTRTANLNRLGEVLHEFTNRLCYTYQNGTDEQRQKIDYCTAFAVKVEKSRPSYDAAKYITAICSLLPEVFDNDFYESFVDAFNNCIVAQYTSRYLMAHNYQVDYSVLLGTEGYYSYTIWQKDEQTGEEVPVKNKRFMSDGRVTYWQIVKEGDGFVMNDLGTSNGSWGSTLADTYEQLTFDRIVGWSRWIKLNRQHPNIFSYANMTVELPEGDVSDNPFF